jgi:hypothetical protein
MDDIAAIVANIPDFHSWNHVKKIKFFAWFLHSQGKEHFSSTDIRLIYEKLHVDKAANITSLLDQLSEKNPKELLKDSRGYSLVGRLRDEMTSKYSARPTAVYVSTLLRELPDRLPDLTERTYLDEALACFNAGAFRASIVMCWNLAYDHLCEFVLSTYLSGFNSQLPKSFPKADISVVGKKDDFQELKESQVLQVCKSVNIISGSLHKILKEKLDRRNIAAHPSGVVVAQPTAEEFIKDLIENVVLKLV